MGGFGVRVTPGRSIEEVDSAATAVSVPDTRGRKGITLTCGPGMSATDERARERNGAGERLGHQLGRCAREQE